jgi:hypothetical protein
MSDDDKYTATFVQCASCREWIDIDHEPHVLSERDDEPRYWCEACLRAGRLN